jgi:adenylate kinase family enzyme
MGASGSGTTTLGRALARRLGWSHLDADDFFWMPTTPPYRERRDPAARLALLLAALDTAVRAVLSGSVVAWGAELESSFDLVVFLWLPPDVRLARLAAREERELGRLDPEFMDWAARYDSADETMRCRRLHERWLGERGCPVLRLEGDMSVEERVERTLAALDE